MSKLDQSRLLQFLRKPRFVREVAEHFGISTKLVNLHLREAIKSGHVLISKKPIFQASETSKDKLKWSGGFLYVLRDSSMTDDSITKLGIGEPKNRASKPKYNFSFVRSAKVHGSVEKKAYKKSSELSAAQKTERPRNPHVNLDTTPSLTSKLNLPPSKVKMDKGVRTEHLLDHETQSTRDAKFLSNGEKICLLRTLLKPANFLDLHGRFGVSKETVKSLMKNGLLTEVWGPKDIGLNFKLTRKGKAYLRELEAAAKCEPKMKKKAFIKLKQMIVY
jgi:hypothetical protein